MTIDERLQLFRDVFSPRQGERVLFLVDLPHGEIKDSSAWQARRQMARQWLADFETLAAQIGFTVEMKEYQATGRNNADIPAAMIEAARSANVVIAMTEFSATAPLDGVCKEPGSITRCASMPGVARKMEETALRADYGEVKIYAEAITAMLNRSVAAEIAFSTGDFLHIDLRNRRAEADSGDCTQAGQCINLPAGEAFKVPYEAAEDEIGAFGQSQTRGTLPVDLKGEPVKLVIEENKITEVKGEGPEAAGLRDLFEENTSRRNIAELGVGCNPRAVVSGSVLEDEKVGLHIAYGLSMHLGGKVDSDLHEDIVYAKGCPVEGTTMSLIDEEGTHTELIRQATLRYELLKGSNK
jgi:aminopeptidase